MSKGTHRCGDIGLLILIYEYNTKISYCIGMVDRLAPRARSAAVRQNPRPSGRGQGELYENVYFPYRAA